MNETFFKESDFLLKTEYTCEQIIINLFFLTLIHPTLKTFQHFKKSIDSLMDMLNNKQI